MTRETYEKLESNQELQALINSDAWANDNQGWLTRQVQEIMNNMGIQDEDQNSYLADEQPEDEADAAASEVLEEVVESVALAWARKVLAKIDADSIDPLVTMSDGCWLESRESIQQEEKL